MKTETFTPLKPGITILKLSLVIAFFTCFALPVAAQFPNPYCNIGVSDAILPITSVEVSGYAANTSSNVVDGTPGLENFTNVVYDMQRGEEITITLKGNTDGPYASFFSVFIDWNQNDNWGTAVSADQDEYYAAGIIYNSSGTDAISSSFTFTVPSHAKLGETRMRVVFNEAALTIACNSRGGSLITYGQAEDYTINVKPDCTSVNVYLGGGAGNWDDGDNWSTGNPPTSAHCVIIPSGINAVISTTGAAAKILTIENNATLTISGSGALTVQDFIVNKADSEDFVIENGGQLVQVNSNDPNQGSYTVRREFNFTNDRNQYNFVISPAIGQVIQDIYPGNPAVIQLNEAENWFYNAPGGGTYIAGKGYSIREPSVDAVPGNSVIAEFEGGIPNGTITYTLTKNLYGVNLVGNPYPSKINSISFYYNNEARIESDIYFWDNRGNQQIAQQGSNYAGNNYATLNAATGVGTAAPGTEGLSGRVPTRYINPGTAFLVEAKSAGPLSFRNTQRSATGGGPDFYGRAGEMEDQEIDVFWLTLQGPNGMETMTAISYFEGGNDEFSIDDSEAFESSDELYSLIDDTQVIIQGKSAFTTKDRVPLGFRTFSPGKHTIELYDTQGIFSTGQTIYLRDRKTKVLHNLSEGPYKFASEAGEINNRFEIIYRNLQFAVTENITIFGKVDITKENKEIVIQSTEEQIVQVEVFDINGKSLYKTNSNTLEVRIPAQHWKKQILIVNAETESGEVISKKLIN